MYDRELVLEILGQIYQATQTILKRFESVKTVSDFTDSSAGMEKFDSICMLLIAIGEALKNLDKTTNKSLLPMYPKVDWKKAKGMRDIISHHYFETDVEVIYDVCKKQGSVSHLDQQGSVSHLDQHISGSKRNKARCHILINTLVEVKQGSVSHLDQHISGSRMPS